MKQSHTQFTRVCFLSRQPTRGFALLGYCYLIVIWIMVLTTTMLTRSSQELRMAERSVDLNQAFWMSEAGLDFTMNQLNTGAVSFDTQGSFPCGSFGTGKTDCRIEPSSVTVREGGVFETIYTITSTGRTTRTGTPNAVAATIRTQQTFSGIVANKYVEAYYRWWTDEDQRITIKGDIRSAWGKVATVELEEGVTVDGDVVIGPPDSTTSPKLPAYTSLIGYEAGAGIRLQKGSTRRWDSKVTGEARAEAMEPVSPVNPPAECKGQAEPLVVDDGERRRIRDGDPLDLSPAGDGRVLMCVPYVNVSGTVTFSDPTILYVTDSFIRTFWFAPELPPIEVTFDNDGRIHAASHLQEQPDRGLTVVITPPPGRSKTGIVFPGKFKGSIFAPASDISLGPSIDEEGAVRRKLGFVVANKLEIDGVAVDFRHRAPKGKAKQQPPSPGTDVTLMSWMTAPASGTTP